MKNLNDFLNNFLNSSTGNILFWYGVLTILIFVIFYIIQNNLKKIKK